MLRISKNQLLATLAALEASSLMSQMIDGSATIRRLAVHSTRVADVITLTLVARRLRRNNKATKLSSDR